MVLPVTAYGHPVLRRPTYEIDENYPDLKNLIDNMFETTHVTDGVGLAAPQINKSISLFIVDASPYAEKYPEVKDFKKVFINPFIVEKTGKEIIIEEGCLSIPNIHEDVLRNETVVLEYFDENFEIHEETFSGIVARIIQHEYDHLEGVLFVDHISNLRKMLLKRKLTDISKGNVDVKYKMIFPHKKKKTH